MSLLKTALVSWQLLRSVHMEKSYLNKAGYPVLYDGNPPLEVAPGQRKTHVNSYRHQTVHRDKVDPRVSELPQCNELCRDHVNTPIICSPRKSWVNFKKQRFQKKIKRFSYETEINSIKFAKD